MPNNYRDCCDNWQVSMVNEYLFMIEYKPTAKPVGIPIGAEPRRTPDLSYFLNEQRARPRPAPSRNNSPPRRW